MDLNYAGSALIVMLLIAAAVTLDLQRYIEMHIDISVNIYDYTALLEGEGSLMKGSTGDYQKYKMKELIKGS
jgi:hypothetical protein